LGLFLAFLLLLLLLLLFLTLLLILLLEETLEISIDGKIFDLDHLANHLLDGSVIHVFLIR